MLDSFMDEQSQLIQQLFVYFYQSYPHTFSYETLTKELNVSYPMLKRILDQIKIIQECYPEFSIERTNKTVTITFSEKFLLNRIRIKLTKENIRFIILDTIFYENFKSLDIFSQNHYLSRRTVQRQIVALTPLLSHYKIELNLKKTNYLVGEEYRIRYLFHSLYWHIYDEIDSNRPPIIQKSAVNIYKKLSTYFPFIRHTAKERFINLLAVSITRIKQGHAIKKIPETVTKIYNPFMTRSIFEREILLPFFESNHLYPDDLTPEELFYLYYMFTVGQSYSHESLEQIQLQSPLFLSKHRRFMEEFIQQIEKYLQFHFGQHERKFILINSTYIFSFLTTFGINKQIDSFGEHLNVSEIDEQCCYLFKALGRIGNCLKTKNPEYLAILKSTTFRYYVSQILSHILMDYDIPIRVAIESKGRGLVEELQKQRLVRLSPRPIMIVRINEHPDVVISDYAINLSTYFPQNLPELFQWGEQQYLSDWVRVIEYIDKIRDRKYTKLFPHEESN